MIYFLIKGGEDKKTNPLVDKYCYLQNQSYLLGKDN